MPLVLLGLAHNNVHEARDLDLVEFFQSFDVVETRLVLLHNVVFDVTEVVVPIHLLIELARSLIVSHLEELSTDSFDVLDSFQFLSYRQLVQGFRTIEIYEVDGKNDEVLFFRLFLNALEPLLLEEVVGKVVEQLVTEACSDLDDGVLEHVFKVLVNKGWQVVIV